MSQYTYDEGHQVGLEGRPEWDVDLPPGVTDDDIEDARRGYQAGVHERLRGTGVVRYTDAPESYDGFGTFTDESLGVSTNHGEVRRVVVQEDYEEWQRGHYMSGMYLAADQEKWDEIKDLVTR